MIFYHGFVLVSAHTVIAKVDAVDLINTFFVIEMSTVKQKGLNVIVIFIEATVAHMAFTL